MSDIWRSEAHKTTEILNGRSKQAFLRSTGKSSQFETAEAELLFEMRKQHLHFLALTR